MVIRLLLIASLLTLGGSPFARQNPPPASPKGTARIAGTVTRADTGKPIASATAQLVPAAGGVPLRARSDERGAFEFTGLAADKYILIVTADGFVALDATVTRPTGVGKLIDVADGQQIEKADVALGLPGAIEGRVLDEFGDPAPGVTIQLAQLMQAAGRSRLMPGGARNNSGPTDDKGQFRFYGLPPGDYYVLALSGPFGLANNSAFSSNGDGLAGFAPTYYPGTDKAVDAKPIRIEVGKTTPSLTFALVSARVSKVSGTILDAAGQPAAAARLMLLQTQGGDVRAIMPANTMSAADGTFTYRNVPPGTYVLQGYAGNGFGTAAVTVPADGAGVTGVALKARALVNARGRITFEGAPPPPKTRVSVGFAPTDFVTGPIGGNRIPSNINDDWTFEINQLCMIGVIRVNAPSPWKMKSVMLGGKEIADTPSDFQTADVNGLEVVMTTELGSVGGTVSDGNRPLANASVAIFSDEPAKWSFPSRFIAVARSNPQGGFNASGLLQGGYLAVAVESVSAMEIDPAWLASMVPLSTPFRISGTESVNVSLKLVKR